MFALLDSADSLFFTCSQDGLIKGQDATSFQGDLKSCVALPLHVLSTSQYKYFYSLRKNAENVSQAALCATNLREDFVNVLKGLTTRINEICYNAKKIRAQISVHIPLNVLWLSRP